MDKAIFVKKLDALIKEHGFSTAIIVLTDAPGNKAEVAILQPADKMNEELHLLHKSIADITITWAKHLKGQIGTLTKFDKNFQQPDKN